MNILDKIDSVLNEAKDGSIKVGDLVKVDMKIVKKYDNISPYIKLVNKAISNAENKTPYVGDVENGKVGIRAWEFDLLGDVYVPIEAVTKIK